MKSRILFYGGLLLAIVLFGVNTMWMPGTRFRGRPPAPSAEVLSVADALKTHVVALSKGIGERRVDLGDSMGRAQHYLVTIAGEIAARTGSTVRLEDVGVNGGHANNVFWDLPGASSELVVVGGHYDSAEGVGTTPGATGRRTRVNYAAPGCLPTWNVFVLSGCKLRADRLARPRAAQPPLSWTRQRLRDAPQ